VSNESQPRWDALREAVFERDDHRCRNCGREEDAGDGDLTVIHIVPERVGGKTDAQNLVTLCKSCAEFDRDRDISAMCDVGILRTDGILERSGYACQNCRDRPEIRGDSFVVVDDERLELHYVVPPERGGERQARNVAVLCRSCHQKAHA
jgi:5-methylcytosine-specific restriction endonuclease McrA